MELREKIADLLYDRLIHDGNQVIEDECASYAAEILDIPEIKEALRELSLRRRIEDRLAGTADERPFIDGEPLGSPNT